MLSLRMRKPDVTVEAVGVVPRSLCCIVACMATMGTIIHGQIFFSLCAATSSRY